MSQRGLILQEPVQRDREARTLLGFLRGQMDGVDGVTVRRRSLKERLGFKRMGCCGATWGFRPTTLSGSHDDEPAEEQERVEEFNPSQPLVVSGAGLDAPSGMNLAAALAAERQYRVSDGGNGTGAVTGSDVPKTPLRVSLMRLLEEADGVEREPVTVMTGTEKEGMGNDMVCCVCMERLKGAAFIPCGHTYCRVCSRELWLNRGACPLCNRMIVEILDIF